VKIRSSLRSIRFRAAIHDEERQELTSQGGLANAVFGGDLQIDPERDATELVTRSYYVGVGAEGS
jgi:hypothetical protein